MSQTSDTKATIGGFSIRYGDIAEKALVKAQGALERARLDTRNNGDHVKSIFTIVHDIKGQAQYFDFGLLATVTASLADIIREHRESWSIDELDMIELHLNTALQVAQSGLLGDGGAMGQEILDALAKLIALAR